MTVHPSDMNTLLILSESCQSVSVSQVKVTFEAKPCDARQLIHPSLKCAAHPVEGILHCA